MSIKTKIFQSKLLQALNNQRRSVLESRPFDYILTPLISRLEKYPPVLTIDTTNHCNAKCVWCHNPQLRYPKGVMSQELFEKIIDDYSQYGGKVWFATFGEPFMDKNILKKVKYARKQSSIENVVLLTNALLLSPEISRELLNLKVDVEVSLDEINKEKFETIKQIDFDRVMKNIMFLLEENKRKGFSINTILRMKTLQSKNEIDQTELYQRLKELGTYIDLTPVESSDSIANWAGSFDKTKFFNKFSPGSIINGSYKSYNLQNDAPCSQLWRNMVVMWDGKVVLCCADMEGEVIVGDLNKNTISEIWSGDKMKNIRELFKKRMKGKIEICKKCDLHQGWQYLKKYFNSTGPLYRNGFLK